MPVDKDRLAAWLKAQGPEFPHQMDAEVQLGPYYADQWLRDPKHVLFGLARYKLVSKLLQGCGRVAEVGAGDGWASEIVRREVGALDLYDLSPLREGIWRYDVMAEPIIRNIYQAIYAIDVFEHVQHGGVFFRNLANSLDDHGKLIIGTPSLESQAYASEPSRKLHINCLSGEDLRALALRHFRHVFILGMNDEVLHAGFLQMCQYLWAICAEPIR